MTDLYFCETRTQANIAYRKIPNKTRESVFISAYPSSAQWFDENTVDYLNAESFERVHSTNDIVDLLKKQIQWAHNVDNFLNIIHDNFEVEFNPTVHYIYYIKSLWDTIIHHAEIIETIITEKEPDVFYYFSNLQPIKIYNGLTFEGSIYAPIISHLCDYHNIYSEPITTTERDQFFKDPNFKEPNYFFRLNQKIRRLLKPYVYRLMYDYQILSLKYNPLKLNTLIIQQSYEFTPEVCSYIERRGYKIINMDTFPLKENLTGFHEPLSKLSINELWGKISKDKWFYRKNGWSNTDLSPLFEPFFYHYITQEIPRLWNNLLLSKKILFNIQPKAIGFGVWESKTIGLLLAAKDLKIPRIMYLHGGSVGDIENPGVVYTIHFLSDFVLVYGPDQAKYINSKDWYPNFSSIPEVVGDARLEWLKETIKPNRVISIKRGIHQNSKKPIVLYVPGSIFTNFYRYSCQNIRNTETFETRKSIFDLVKSHADSISFVYKPFVTNHEDPTCKMIEKNYPNIRMIGDISLPELQCAADLIIQEVPSSGMYESMITDKPMIVLVNRHIYDMPDYVKQLLSKRVHIASDTNEFINMIQDAMNDIPNWIQSNDNKDFWKRFCVPEDGKSAILAAEKIHEIILSWKYE